MKLKLLTILLFISLGAKAQTIIYASSYMTNTTANQTTQLQAALNACDGTSLTDTCVLVLPDYNFYTKQVTPKSYTKIVGGTGEHRPYLANGEASGRLWYVFNKQGVSIRNVKVNMLMAPGDLLNGWCGISFEGNSRYISIVNNYLWHTARNNSIATNYYTNTYGWAGIKIVSCSDGVITGNTVLNTDANIHFSDDGTYENRNWEVYNNSLGGGTSEGIHVSTYVSSSIKGFNMNFYGNTIWDKPDSYGILLTGVDGFDIYGNIVIDCAFGIALSSENIVGDLGGGFYQHAPINGLVYNNKVYRCGQGFKGNGSYTSVYNNHFGSSWTSGINTERGFGETSNYTAQYFYVYNNKVDSVGLSGNGEAFAFKGLSNSKIVNNLFRTRSNSGGVAGFRFYGSTYGTGSVIKNNIIDNNVYFETNYFSQANTFTGNYTTGYNTFTPGGSWTVSGNTIGTWVQPTGTTAGSELFFYNQTGSATVYPFSGLYKLTGNIEYNGGITLANETSAILFRGVIQLPEPGIIIKRRVIVQ